jgi:hypothetical protein
MCHALRDAADSPCEQPPIEASLYRPIVGPCDTTFEREDNLRSLRLQTPWIGHLVRPGAEAYLRPPHAEGTILIRNSQQMSHRTSLAIRSAEGSASRHLPAGWF